MRAVSPPTHVGAPDEGWEGMADGNGGLPASIRHLHGHPENTAGESAGPIEHARSEAEFPAEERAKQAAGRLVNPKSTGALLDRLERVTTINLNLFKPIHQYAQPRRLA